MMADESPDLGAALRTYIQESTVLISEPYLGNANKIYVGLPKNKEGTLFAPPFSDFIAILTGRGGRGDIELGLYEERVDFQCYGSTEGKCKKLARALIWYLNPLDVRRQTSFTRRSCRVLTITQESAPLALVDADAANWPYTNIAYIVKYSGVPVS